MSHPSLFFYAQLVYAKQDGMRGSWMTYCPQKETGGKVHLQSWVRLRNRTLFTNCTFNSHHCIALNKLRGQNGSIVRFLLITEFVKLESLLSWNNPAASLMWILVSALLYDTIYCFLFFFLVDLKGFDNFYVLWLCRCSMQDFCTTKVHVHYCVIVSFFYKLKLTVL